MKEYTINQAQYNTLSGLRHWMAVKAKMIERYPDVYETDADNIHKTITFLFKEADQQLIPFWVQNIVCYYQDDWRHTLDHYLYQDLERHGVDCENVSIR